MLNDLTYMQLQVSVRRSLITYIDPERIVDSRDRCRSLPPLKEIIIPGDDVDRTSSASTLGAGNAISEMGLCYSLRVVSVQVPASLSTSLSSLARLDTFSDLC